MIVGRVMAMARPCRPASEGELVRQAAQSLTGSARQRALRIAKDVAAVAVRDAELNDDDAMLLITARQMLSYDPTIRLATEAEFDTVGMVNAERARRFAERGCRQLSPYDWRTETAAIERALTGRLARRYRALLK